jgi:hypothetical protein
LFRRLLRYRIPAYQAGLAASVLLFFLVYSFIRTHHLSVQLATTDTVFIDRPVTLTDTVWLEKPVEPAPKMTGSSVHRTSREKEPVDERVDNPLYTRQMEEALARIAAITELSKDKPGFRDAALMKLVSTGLPATGE